MPDFIRTERLVLSALQLEDISDDYLGWLNDPEVLRYRSRSALPTTREQMRDYIASIPARGDLVLAIRLRDGGRHIGNVALNTISWMHGSAELSIMIGAKDVWGKGFGHETIKAVTQHAFEAMRLRRIWAESPNPAFNAVVRSLGWTHEGTKRDAFLVGGEFVDLECWGILRDEAAARDRTS